MEEDANNKHGHANCSEKLKRRKTTVEIVVKARLQNYLRGDGRQRLCNADQVRVLVFLQPYHLVGIALSGRLKECFDGLRTSQHLCCLTGRAHPFYKQLVLFVEDAQKPDPTSKCTTSLILCWWPSW